MPAPALDPELKARLGPLAALVGTWEGDQGFDVAPDGDVREESRYRERMTFEPLGPVENSQQVLYGLDYRTFAWRIGDADPFHREVGYWLWDAEAGLVMRCFMVPRGVTVLACGQATVESRVLIMAAEVGSTTAGVLSNPPLDGVARTVRYDLTVELLEDGGLRYHEDTVLAIAGLPDLFHHTDENTLHRV